MPRISPEIINLEMVNADEEYVVAIPRDVLSFDIQARQSRDIRVSVGEEATGNGPWWTIKADTTYYKDVPLEKPAGDLRFRDPDNVGTIVELLLWREHGM